MHTNWFAGRYASTHEVQPELNLLSLYVRRVRETEHYAVDTVRITDEMVVADVVTFSARELPDTQITDTCTLSALAL